MNAVIETMTIDHYDEVHALWRALRGVRVNELDSLEGITAFLDRNPELSLVLLVDGKIAGAVMVGHDGRLGYLHHLAVHPQFQRRGFGRRLVDESLRRLRAVGVLTAYAFVVDDNDAGFSFWRALGFTRRDVTVMLRPTR